jgi:hypothetical protein
VIGRRVYDKSPHELFEGEYSKWGEHDGYWYAHCPGEHDLIANLSSHQVIEHEDGTITVSPSILCTDGAGGHSYHGYLERGIWRTA